MHASSAKRDPIKYGGCHCLQIRMLSRAVTKLYDRKLADSGLTIAQYGLLRNIQRYGSLTVNDLAEKMDLDHSTINRNLRPLSKKGMVNISAGKDRRTKNVSISGPGTELLRKAHPHWEAAQKAFETLAGTEAVRALSKLLAAESRLTRQNGN